MEHGYTHRLFWQTAWPLSQGRVWMDTISTICLYTDCLIYLLLSVISWKVTSLVNCDLAGSLHVCVTYESFSAKSKLRVVDSFLLEGAWFVFPISHLVFLFRPDKRETLRGISVLQMTAMGTQRQRQQMEEAMICWWHWSQAHWACTTWGPLKVSCPFFPFTGIPISTHNSIGYSSQGPAHRQHTPKHSYVPTFVNTKAKTTVTCKTERKI